MTFSKLFGSIIHSSIWQEPDHVRIVWVTMLAMKDRDGVVEAAVIGLAKAAGKTLAETEDALRVLSSPDPHSRTADHEGRRIDAIPGGWIVLNHNLYRDKLDRDDVREKARVRKANQRESKHKRDVTRGHAMSHDVPACPVGPLKSRHAEAEAEAEAEADPERGVPVGSSSSQPPDLGGGGDLGRRPIERPVPPAPPLPDGPTDAELRRMLWPIEQAINRARVEVAKRLKLPEPRHEHPTPKDTTDAMARLRESRYEATARFEHVLAVAKADAIATNSIDYLGWCIFREQAWGAKIRKTIARPKHTAAPPRFSEPPIQVELDAEEREALAELARNVAANPTGAKP
jgi:hypothetical protein